MTRQYKNLADYYEFIFPSKKKIEFLNDEFQNESYLLDIGCSDGRVAKGLGEIGFKIEAIDLDEDMIRVAKEVNKDIKDVNVKLLDMSQVDKHFQPNSFDGIYCIGNTLVHLPDYKTIEDTLKKFKNLLKKDKKLIIQILNYDYIYKNNIRELPLIQNEKIKFERYYTLKEEKTIFKTKLRINKTGQELDGQVELFPIRKEELEKALKEAGFNDFTYYGGFGKKDFSIDAMPLIVVAK